MKVLRFALLLLLATACVRPQAHYQKPRFSRSGRAAPGGSRAPEKLAGVVVPHRPPEDLATGEEFGVEYVFFHFNPDGKQD